MKGDKLKDAMQTQDESLDEKRHEHRTPTLGVIVYFLPPSGDMDPLFEGLIFNLSNNGVGIIAVKPIEAGATVRISSSAIAGTPREATVQWCNHINGNLYKFGLSLN